MLLAGIGCALPAPADAQSGYPNRPVRILVPYGPGGVADTTVRLLAQRLNDVPNRSGRCGAQLHSSL